MQTVTTAEGIDIRRVNHEPIGKDSLSRVVLSCLWLSFIPFGGIVMCINAYLHNSRTYVMCFYDNGMQDVECYKQLNQEELKEERINALTYGLCFALVRLLPIGYYLINHAYA